MNAREQILTRIRAALVAAPGTGPVPRDYRRSGEADAATLVERLSDRLTDYRASVHGGLSSLGTVLGRTTTLVVPADLPEAWLAEASRAGFSGTVRAAPVPVSELDSPGVSVLTGCVVAIAETGTIVLDGGPAQGPRVLSLVPDHLVCVVAHDQIVATVPQALAALPDPTRPLTFISGPSATSDIELNRVEGVHGPRRLDVILRIR